MPMISLMFQDASSPSMEHMLKFHDFSMVILTSILILVGVSLILISTEKLSTRLLLQEQKVEVIWTVIPIFLLMLIALPSLQSLYLIDDPLAPSLTLKTIGHQWYWSYEYSDFPNTSFDSYMLPFSDSKPKMRLLDTNNSVPLPTNTTIRIMVTAMDVIHSWAMPSLGLKADAVPGRLNQIMLTISRPGLYFGQCSEICGLNHSFMPIKIEAIPMKFFIQWLAK